MSEKKLSHKLVEISAELERVPKNGYNDFHKYHYVQEADAVEALRGACVKRGLHLSFSAVPGTINYEHRPGNKGDLFVGASLLLELRITDSETGEQFTTTMPGYGEDKGDKGIYKAITGAKKYAIMLAFSLATNDDPEREAKRQNRNQQGAVNKMWQPQRVDLENLARELGVSLDEWIAKNVRPDYLQAKTLTKSQVMEAYDKLTTQLVGSR